MDTASRFGTMAEASIVAEWWNGRARAWALRNESRSSLDPGAELFVFTYVDVGAARPH